MASNGNRGNSRGTDLRNQQIEYSDSRKEVPHKVPVSINPNGVSPANLFQALVPVEQIFRRLREDLKLPLKQSIVTTVQCNSLVDATPAGKGKMSWADRFGTSYEDDQIIDTSNIPSQEQSLNFHNTEEAEEEDIDPSQLVHVQKKKF